MSNNAQLSAIDRITTLLDTNSFVEVGADVTSRSTDFNLTQNKIPADGVITGYGTIDDNPVYIFSQDSSALGGSIGEMHAKKIISIYDLALKVGAPVIGLIDSSGMRLQEATDAMNGFGQIYMKQTLASGVIPQITAIFGNCGGGLAVMASLSDFTFITKKNARLFVNSPNALSENYTEKNNTSEADFVASAGNVDYVGQDESEVLEKIRELISILPINNEDDTYYTESKDDINRLLTNIESFLNDSSRVLSYISDNNFFYELKANYAKEMVTGFINLNGMTVGAVANRREVLDEANNVVEKFDGSLTSDGCNKASSFVNFCDAFSIPLLTLTNVSGFSATVEEEKTIASAVSRLIYAFANASVPKVNFIVGDAYGSPYISMNSKHIGADLVFALPNAKIGMMEADLASQIMYEGESEEVRKERANEYKQLKSSAQSAAKRGYVDTIIEAESMRKHAIYSFEMLFTKYEYRPSKKHGSK